MNYVYSDPHFFHKNIIKYCGRPFNDVEEMNATLIKNWNSVITKGDTVFLLGDFGFGTKEQMQELVGQLKGRITLIMGNHDRRKSATWWRDCGFHAVSEYPILLQGRYIMSHEPIAVTGDFINVHGHIHEKDSMDEFHINICVEKTNYTPMTFEKMTQLV